MRIGLIATAYFYKAHADVIASRWIKPRAGDAKWGWAKPKTQIVAAHIIQRYEDDIGVEFLRENGVPHFDDIESALTMGGDTLAVDAVLFVGEHGRYDYNELGQKLYPRKEIFDEIVDVFKKTGKSVPVFVDKYFSWNSDWCQQMWDTAEEMGFMLLGGSSITLPRRVPPIELPMGLPIDEAVGVYYQLDEIYGYHGFENLQSMVERRAGGETGIESVTVWRGDEVWEQLDKGAWSADLMQAAVDSYPEGSVKAGDLRANCTGIDRDDIPERAKGPITAFQFRYRDGLKATMVNLGGHCEGFAAACLSNGNTVAAYAEMSDVSEFWGHFATLSAVVEESFLTGKPLFPQERVLMSSKAISAMMKTRATPGVTVPTPELAISYTPEGYVCASTPDGSLQDYMIAVNG